MLDSLNAQILLVRKIANYQQDVFANKASHGPPKILHKYEQCSNRARPDAIVDWRLNTDRPVRNQIAMLAAYWHTEVR